MMESQQPRLALTISAWFVLVVAVAAFLYTQGLIDKYQQAVRAFELAARDATDALDDALAGQQAYVAIGQDAGDWSKKVATYLRTATTRIEQLKANASHPSSLTPLRDASVAADTLASLDRRIGADLASGEMRTASELVFGESADAISSAMSFVDAAVAAERQTTDDRVASLRRLLAIGLSLLGVILAGLVGMLGFSRQRSEQSETAAEPVASTSPSDAALESEAARILIAGSTPEYPVLDEPAADEASAEALTRIAGICTEFGRVQSGEELQQLVRRAADVMQARGVIVWLGNRSGGDLRPVLAHGYSDATLARLAPITRTADNATAAAYRNSEVQVVRARPGEAQGAIAAPLLASDGCIGALTAEIVEYGAEDSGRVRALATILASQLAGVLSAASESTGTATTPVAEAAS